MRVLGLDFGSKTVGVAVSDPFGWTAQGVEIIRREREDKLRKTYARIEAIIAEYGVTEIILGYPVMLSGEEGTRVEKTKVFKETLERRTGLPVHFRDERLTSVEAHEIMTEAGIPQKEHYLYVDKIAAQIILQGYLDELADQKKRKEIEDRTKLLFFDIDGTLAWPGQPISERTVQALKQAQANGHKLFLCTGRGHVSIAPEIRQVGFDGGIYQVGKIAEYAGERIVDKTVPDALWRGAIEKIRDQILSYSIDCDHETYRAVDLDPVELQARYGLPVELIKTITGYHGAPMKEYHGDPVYKVIIRCDGIEHVKEIRRRLEGIAKVSSYESFTAENSLIHCDLEFGHDSKATAMDAICAFLGKTREDCIAFGDGLNDLEVIRAAGIGVAMGNAHEQVLKEADCICESCLEDGIARELERMELL